MGKITTGKWFYLFADHDFDLKVNGGTAQRMLLGHPISVHMNFTTLTVSTVGAEALRLTWAVAGD
jgi:hypothetical protein